MTAPEPYRAQRYTRYGVGPHPCPRAYPNDPHNLIPDPERRSAWVCPMALDAERANAQMREEARQEEEARHERARAIARNLAGDAASDPLVRASVIEHDDLLDMLTDAVLAGMAEERAQ